MRFVKDICNSRGEYAYYPRVRWLLAKGEIGMNKQIASEGSVSQWKNVIASPGQINTYSKLTPKRMFFNP